MGVLIYPPTLDWHRMVQRPQQLLWQAAGAGNAVIFCNRTQRSEKTMEKLSDRLYVCHNFELLEREVFPGATLYCTRPEHVQLVGSLGTTRAIFDLVDALPDSPELKAALDGAAEVWTASARVHAAVSTRRRDARLIANAADIDSWSAPQRSRAIACDLLPAPRVVYTGTVSEWFDLEGLFALAKAFPRVSFLLVGPVEAEAWAVAPPPKNVWALGERPYADLATYAHAADALILPYRPEHPVAQGSNPVKLWNYLATGRPVVVNGVPLAGELASAVYTGELAAALEAALGERNPRAAERRRLIAAANTWSDRWRTCVEVAA